MENLPFYLLLLIFYNKDVLCNVEDTETVARYTEDKIVGGNETTIEMYNYQAYILLSDGRDNYECGGSIISEQHILTAAHCFVGMRSATIRIGSTDKFSGGDTYEMETFYSHPLYDRQTLDYDVTVVKLKETMNLDGVTSKIIDLVNVGHDPAGGETVVITGWGRTVEGGNSSRTLRVARTQVVNRTRCNELLPSTVTSRMFCAGLEEGGVDTCQGDSGGPVALTTRHRLAGITSHGYGCARPKSPGVYTRIGNMAIRSFIRLMAGV